MPQNPFDSTPPDNVSRLNSLTAAEQLQDVFSQSLKTVHALVSQEVAKSLGARKVPYTLEKGPKPMLGHADWQKHTPDELGKDQKVEHIRYRRMAFETLREAFATVEAEYGPKMTDAERITFEYIRTDTQKMGEAFIGRINEAERLRKNLVAAEGKYPADSEPVKTAKTAHKAAMALVMKDIDGVSGGVTSGTMNAYIGEILKKVLPITPEQMVGTTLTAFKALHAQYDGYMRGSDTTFSVKLPSALANSTVDRQVMERADDVGALHHDQRTRANQAKVDAPFKDREPVTPAPASDWGVKDPATSTALPDVTVSDPLSFSRSKPAAKEDDNTRKWVIRGGVATLLTLALAAGAYMLSGGSRPEEKDQGKPVPAAKGTTDPEPKKVVIPPKTEVIPPKVVPKAEVVPPKVGTPGVNDLEFDTPGGPPKKMPEVEKAKPPEVIKKDVADPAAVKAAAVKEALVKRGAALREAVTDENKMAALIKFVVDESKIEYTGHVAAVDTKSVMLVPEATFKAGNTADALSGAQAVVIGNGSLIKSAKVQPADLKVQMDIMIPAHSRGDYRIVESKDNPGFLRLHNKENQPMVNATTGKAFEWSVRQNTTLVGTTFEKNPLEIPAVDIKEGHLAKAEIKLEVLPEGRFGFGGVDFDLKKMQPVAASKDTFEAIAKARTGRARELDNLSRNVNINENVRTVMLRNFNWRHPVEATDTAVPFAWRSFGSMHATVDASSVFGSQGIKAVPVHDQGKFHLDDAKAKAVGCTLHFPLSKNTIAEVFVIMENRNKDKKPQPGEETSITISPVVQRPGQADKLFGHDVTIVAGKNPQSPSSVVDFVWNNGKGKDEINEAAAHSRLGPMALRGLFDTLYAERGAAGRQMNSYCPARVMRSDDFPIVDSDAIIQAFAVGVSDVEQSHKQNRGPNAEYMAVNPIVLPDNFIEAGGRKTPLFAVKDTTRVTGLDPVGSNTALKRFGSAVEFGNLDHHVIRFEASHVPTLYEVLLNAVREKWNGNPVRGTADEWSNSENIGGSRTLYPFNEPPAGHDIIMNQILGTKGKGKN